MKAQSSSSMHMRYPMTSRAGAMSVLSLPLSAKRMVFRSFDAHWWWNFYVEGGIGFVSTFRFLPVFIKEDVAS